MNCQKRKKTKYHSYRHISFFFFFIFKLQAFGGEPLEYVGGAAPRTHVVGDVFTANEAPPDKLIPFHHEMAQVGVVFYFTRVL